MRKKRITTAALCAIMCVAIAGIPGCASPETKSEPAQASAVTVVQEREQEQASMEEQSQKSEEPIAQNPFTGTWVICEVTVDGVTFGKDNLTEIGFDKFSVDLADDGSFTMTGGIAGTWESNGDASVTLTSSDDTMYGTLVGDKLSIDSEGNKCVFERSGDSSSKTDGSGILNTSNFTVKDLKIEGEDRTEKLEEQNNYFGDIGGEISDHRYQYVVTGTLVNNSGKDAGQVVVSLQVTEKTTDDYGEEVTTTADEDITSMSLGAIGNTFYDVKAGEEREFSFAFNSGAVCADPILWVVDVTPAVDPFNSDLMFGDDEFDVVFDADTDSYDNRTHTIKSKVDGLIDRGTFYYAYTDASGTWYEDSRAITRLWPGETYELKESLSTFYTSNPQNLTFLGMTYALDNETTVKSFRDEFDIDIDEDAHVLKLTNKTGHYLERVQIEGDATHADGVRGFYSTYAKFIAPGATAEIELTEDDVSSAHVEDFNVFDITYDIDESKE